MIMLLHDICDVPVAIARLLRYSGRQTSADACFAVFCITWVVMRMVYFPLVIIRSTWYESITYAAIPYNIEPQPHHGVLNALLMTLFVLHTYWSYRIFLVLYKGLSGPRYNRGRAQLLKDAADTELIRADASQFAVYAQVPVIVTA
jgi:hypothetical protein